MIKTILYNMKQFIFILLLVLFCGCRNNTQTLQDGIVTDIIEYQEWDPVIQVSRKKYTARVVFDNKVMWISTTADVKKGDTLYLVKYE